LSDSKEQRKKVKYRKGKKGSLRGGLGRERDKIAFISQEKEVRLRVHITSLYWERKVSVVEGFKKIRTSGSGLCSSEESRTGGKVLRGKIK